MDTVSYLLGKNASGGGSSLQNKSVEINTNTTTIITPDTGYDGLSRVNVTTNVPSEDVAEKDVNLYDYDGTLLFSYTKDEFLALEEYPTPPAKELLTFQNWNWTLADAQVYVGKYGGQCIGATYTTKDGETKIHIDIDGFKNEGLFNEINFYITPTGSAGSASGKLTINWGDGTSSETSTEYSSSTINKRHTYSQKGKYIISTKFEPLTGDAKLVLASGGTSAPLLTNSERTIKEINIGNEIMIKSTNQFYNYYALEKVSLPNGVFSTTASDLSNVFFNCHLLKGIILPSGTVGLGGNSFFDCNNLKIISIPKSLTTFGSSTGSSSQSTFQYASALKYIYLPETYTGPLSQLQNSRPFSLEIICAPTTATDFVHNNSAISSGPFNLKKIIYPTGITALPLTPGCLIQHLDIPSNITTIPSLSSWNSLRSVKMSKNISSIASSPFSSAKIRYLIFTDNTSIPTLSGNWTGTNPSNIIFIVPDDLYDDWIVAENWASLSDRIIRESDFNN